MEKIKAKDFSNFILFYAIITNTSKKKVLSNIKKKLYVF